MTEEEAKTKWCPMVRLGDSGGNNQLLLGGTHSTLGHCIGSACMMWRERRGYDAGELKLTSGYCGLAGKS